MKIKYQVQSRLKEDEWQDDHMPFDNQQEAINYIYTQPRTFEYRIVLDEYPETDSEFLEIHDALDAIGGDWQG